MKKKRENQNQNEIAYAIIQPTNTLYKELHTAHELASSKFSFKQRLDIVELGENYDSNYGSSYDGDSAAKVLKDMQQLILTVNSPIFYCNENANTSCFTVYHNSTCMH